VYGLDDQIEVASSFIEMTLRSDKYYTQSSTSASSKGGNKQRVILIGHSIGAYIILEALDRVPFLSSMTTHAVLLMPFIFWPNLPFSHKTKLVAFRNSFPLARFIAQSAISRLMAQTVPSRASFIARHANNQFSSDLLQIVASRLFSRRLVDNFLNMGRDECFAIQQNTPRMMALLKRFTSEFKVLALYTKDDVWAPQEDLHVLHDSLPHIFSSYLEHVTHAFSLNAETTAPVLCAVQDFLLHRGTDGTRVSSGDGSSSSSKLDVGTPTTATRSKL